MLPEPLLRLWKLTKSILDVVHETATDLSNAGLLNQTTMREFDALCLPPVSEYSAAQIRAIRTRCGASQSVFAAYLNTSASTVKQWEQGKKRPAKPSLKLLNLVDRKGLEILA